MDVTTILAELPHPTTLGAPLARGAKYQHHFVVDLISDGKRLWHAASAEGQAILSAIKREVSDELDAAESTLAKARAEELARLQATKPESVQHTHNVMSLEELMKIRDDVEREIAKVAGVSVPDRAAAEKAALASAVDQQMARLSAQGTPETDADPGNPNVADDDTEAAAKPQ